MNKQKNPNDGDREGVIIGLSLTSTLLFSAYILATAAINSERYKLREDIQQVLSPEMPKPTNNLVSTNSIR